MERQTSEEVKKNILRVKSSIQVARLLALQGHAFRGHDESIESTNRGNFIEHLQFLADNNEEIDSVVLDNAPLNAKYISPEIQKQILHVLAKKIAELESRFNDRVVELLKLSSSLVPKDGYKTFDIAAI
ncbi:unnamed protein product [Linum tenue]|uniref:DUF4371 domain-containing protein n=1 Tax=Linum tenue TaxID=586396 RepID=A0AAV0NEC5_9ROSI|nr:unnamed protein product [Linum tenue]